MPNLRPVSETTSLSEAAASAAKKSGRMLIEFITPGWGTSGYYGPEVLEQAAADRVIPKGTHMYADHPTLAEDQERPIRSIKDLMAVTTEDAHLSEAGSLVGEVQVVPGWQPFLEAVHEDIGVSIRGAATDIVEGEAEGRRGGIIEGLVAPVLSADFVTRAGRGGKVLQLLESAAATHRAVEHGVEEATANDLRDALSTTLRETYAQAEKTYAWVRDFDTTTVWFEIESPTDNGIYAQGYTDNGMTLTGDRTEVRVQTSYVPVNTTTEASLPTPAGRTINRPEEDTMPQIEEARLRQLEEDAGRVPTLITERDTAVAERDAAVAEARNLRNAQAARDIIAEDTTVRFSPLEVRGLLAELPVTESGDFDADAFRTTVTGLIEEARTARARHLEEGGVGAVSGFGGQPTGDPKEVSESDLDDIIAGAFGRPVKEA